MKATLKKNGNTAIVSLAGQVDYESQEPLRNELIKIIKNNKNTDSTPTKLIFDLQNLEFVGSCGLSNLIQTFKEINQASTIPPLYCHVGSEFKKLIQAFDEDKSFSFEESMPVGSFRDH